MEAPPSERSATALGRAGLVVTAANVAANLLAYLVPVLGSRRLDPADLGALASAMALVAIATIPGIGLQTAVAVAVARSGPSVAAARWAWTVAGGCAGAVLLATPLLVAALRLPLAVPPLLAAMVFPAVLAGWPLGVLQGSERFGRLAAGTVALAAGRYGGVLIGLLAGTGLTGAVALGALVAWSVPVSLWWLLAATGRSASEDAPPPAAAIGRDGLPADVAGSRAPVVPAAGSGADAAASWAPVVPAAGSGADAAASWAPVEPAAGSGADAAATRAPVVPAAGSDEDVAGSRAPAAPVMGAAGGGSWAAGAGGRAAESSAAGALRGRPVLAAASASLAILVASYADLLLARRLLPPGESGAYAVGAVLTRAAIWAPQVVTIVALPRLAKGRGAALRVGLALVVAAGVALVGAAWLAAGTAVRAIGGARYADLAHLAPYFVATGALYAVTVFLINAQIAAGVRRPAAGLWAIVAGFLLAAAILRPATVGQMLACAVAAAAAAVLVTGVAVAVRRRREAVTGAR